MKGYNGAILAYGQTGSGKTHTMMGDMDNSDFKGLTPRIVESIFATIAHSPTDIEFTVKVSYMEIYMERIRDLLNPLNDNLPVHEDKFRGVYVKGLLEIFVSSVHEVCEAMRRGQGCRAVAYTNMNAESSRSHSIFMLQITQKSIIDGTATTGRLHLVDLAGSEKVGKSGATGQTLEEAKKINRSLSTLGMVINALTDGKSTHVPYRDSKLTRILQESIGGNSRTTLIVNCSPAPVHEAETISTLRFGVRAKSIKNTAKINVELSPTELKALLKKAKSELSTLHRRVSGLEKELELWRSGSFVDEQDRVSTQSSDFHSPSPFYDPTTSRRPPSLPHTPFKPASSVFNQLPSTPMSAKPTPLSDDEREAFLRREEDLEDQLQAKESDLKDRQSLLDSLTEDLHFLKTREAELSGKYKDLSASAADMKLGVEKLRFENKDLVILVEAMQDQKAEMQGEIQQLRTQLYQAQQQTAKAQTSDGEEIQKMMAALDPLNDIEEKETEIRESLSKLRHATESSHTLAEEATDDDDGNTSGGEMEDLKKTLDKTQHELNASLSRQKELQDRIQVLETEHSRVLAKFSDSKIVDDQPSLNNNDWLQVELESLTTLLGKKDDQMRQLETENMNLKKSNEMLQTGMDSHALKNKDEIAKLQDSMVKQLDAFDEVKKKMVSELQTRCERIAELEVQLEQGRRRESTSKGTIQQGKLEQLESQLGQLVQVQKQLVDQNNQIKTNMSVCQRKLEARNERIEYLQQLLRESQASMEIQSQLFESQLSEMRERLRQHNQYHCKAQNIYIERDRDREEY